MKSSQMNYILQKTFAISIILIGCFFSCSKNVKANSIIATLDEIDRYITQDQTQSAIKLLDKTDKNSLSPNIRLGLYRRYIQLGENQKAEKLLKSCFKKNPSDIKVIAVYSSFLLKQGKIKEAFDLSKKLSGTEYGSIYAEALLKTVNLSVQENISFVDFCIPEYASVFLDAYSGSKNNAWLRNCATISLLSGNLDQAFSYLPQDLQNAEDAYFWSLVCYDNRKFVESSENLNSAKDFVNREISDIYQNKVELSKKQNLSLKIRSLLADSYINLSEEKLAENERNLLLSFLTSFDEDSLIEDFSDNEFSEAYSEDFLQETSGGVLEKNQFGKVDLLSVIYLNSALWSLANQDYKGAYNLLFFEVNKWPDYVPGLIAWANFAYNSSLVTFNDPMTQELRKLGLSSMDMKAFDELPKVPVQDAIFRMEDSLSRFKNFELFVAKLDLEDKIEQISEKAHLAKIYQTLERNTLGTNYYPPEITRYAVHALMMHDKKQDAETLFNKYLAQRYSFVEKANFYDELFTNIHLMETWEIEYAAWFAALAKNASLSAGLYEFIVFNEYLKDQKQIQEISPRATLTSMINLAMIYSSTNKKEEAISLYGKASNHASNVKLKSECLYRIAVLYTEQKQTLDAIKSLKYSIYLNPEHSKARLLLAKLNENNPNEK